MSLANKPCRHSPRISPTSSQKATEGSHMGPGRPMPARGATDMLCILQCPWAIVMKVTTAGGGSPCLRVRASEILHVHPSQTPFQEDPAKQLDPKPHLSPGLQSSCVRCCFPVPTKRAPPPPRAAHKGLSKGSV